VKVGSPLRREGDRGVVRYSEARAGQRLGGFGLRDRVWSKRARGAAAKSVAAMLAGQTLRRRKPMRGSAAGEA
jgi:hypothetical protein